MNSAEITGLDGITVVLLLCYSGIMEAWHHCGITIVLPGSVGSYCHAQFTQSRGREGGKSTRWNERTTPMLSSQKLLCPRDMGALRHSLSDL